MTEEEKKEFEEFLLWKKEREKQKTEVPVNAPITNSKEESQQEKCKNNPSNKKEENSSSIGIIICLLVLLGVGLLVFSQFKSNPNSPTESTLAADSLAADTTVIDSTQDKIEQEVSEKAKQEAELKKTYIKITSAYLRKPDSAGGCDAHISFKNTSDNTIKYLRFQCAMYNAVGDIISDELERDGMRLKYTGPLKPGRSDSSNWDCVIYNYSAKRLVITSLDIEYMNGTTIHYNENEVKALIKK